LTFFDDFELTDGCRIQKLSKGEQLARWPQQRRREFDDAAIMATHALVVPRWALTVENWFIWLAVPEEPSEDVPQQAKFFKHWPWSRTRHLDTPRYSHGL
jgi:hypothetical protein